MSKTGKPNYRRSGREGHKLERRLSIRAIRREQPDVRRLGRAFIALAMADAEREAQASTPVAESAEANINLGSPDGSPTELRHEGE
jgi:hypothetical protein